MAFIIVIPNRFYIKLFFLSCTLSGSGSFSFTGDNLDTASSPKAIKGGYAVYMSLKYKVFFFRKSFARYCSVTFLDDIKVVLHI